jgi:hypothetical protein
MGYEIMRKSTMTFALALLAGVPAVVPAQAQQPMTPQQWCATQAGPYMANAILTRDPYLMNMAERNIANRCGSAQQQQPSRMLVCQHRGQYTYCWQ